MLFLPRASHAEGRKRNLLRFETQEAGEIGSLDRDTEGRGIIGAVSGFDALGMTP